MILLEDSIRYTNVISKKYRYHYNDMNEIMESFINEIINVNATVKGPMFYSINNVPMDKMVNAELFMPVHEDKVVIKDDMLFHSYYNIENMITFCLYDQFEKTSEIGYSSLLQYMKQNQLRQVTPIFHVFSGDRSLQYLFIKIGVTPEKKEEPVWR